MANQIILKRSSTPSKVPTTSQLALGEIAINTHDGLLYIKKDDGTPSVVQIGGVTSVNGKTGSAVLSTSDVAEGTAQYFTNARARSALSAGTGISYNSSTGAISTAQNLSTEGSPTFAGMTLTGGMGITGSIIPSADITYDLGSPTKQWKDIYVGPGSLYVNGSKVLEDVNDTITFSADADQNIRIKTTGTGILQLGTATTNVNIDGTLQIAAGKMITDSAGIKVNFGDNIEMNGNKVIGLGTPSSGTDAATKSYVDSTVAAISTSSISQGNSNISVVDSGTGTVTVTVDGSTALTVDANGVVVAGNFTVSGTTTTVNSNTIALADNILTLNSDTTGTPTQNAGIEVERGDEANVQVRWNEGSKIWTFTNDGAVYNPIAVNTDGLTEGSTNQYFTNSRARSALSVTANTGISYNSATGTFNLGSIPNSSLTNNSITINGSAVALGGTRTLDTDAISEGASNKYFSNTLARGAISFTAGSGAYNSSTGVLTIPTNTNQLTNGAGFATEAFVTSAVAGKDNTDEITEGTTNLYFTNARARSAVSAGTGISYNSTTGVITNTITQYTDALARGAVSGGTGISYNSTTGVIAVSNGVYTTDTGTVTNTMLAGSIANAKLANSSVTVGTTAIALGTTATTLSGLTSVTSTSFVGALTGNASTATSATTATNVSGGTVSATTGSFSGAVSTGALTVSGGITATGEITAYFSDERLKTDISPISGALDKVMAIGGYTYKANDLAHELGVSRYDNQIGLLAQEVEAVMPELVTQSGLPGYKTIRYDKVVSVLVEAIKEQQAMIEELRKDVKKTLH
jgi:hypothetical protein